MQTPGYIDANHIVIGEGARHWTAMLSDAPGMLSVGGSAYSALTCKLKAHYILREVEPVP